MFTVIVDLTILSRHVSKGCWIEHHWFEQNRNVRENRRRQTNTQTKIWQMCQNIKILHFLFISLFFFLPFVEWGSRNVSLPATFPFLCCTGMMKAFFILTLPRWLSDALFKSVLIFSFAWLHYEEVLSTLGNKKHRE